MSPGLGTAAPSRLQDFILSHLVNENAQIYCGHQGEAYTGVVVACSDGILTIEKNGNQTFIACDKIESMRVV